MGNTMFVAIFGLVGFIMFIYGVYKLTNYLRKKRQCQLETTATIIDVMRKERGSSNGKGPVEYIPVISYKIHGKKYSAETDLATRDGKKYEEGQSITILYNEKQPESFYVKGNKSAYWTAIGMIVIGILIIGSYGMLVK